MNHQHTLQLNNGPQASSIFLCSVCKELGVSEYSYICENRYCNYIVHKKCAVPLVKKKECAVPVNQEWSSSTHMNHQHTLQLNNGPQASSIFLCSVCKELGVSEYSYICENRNCNYIVHKKCAVPLVKKKECAVPVNQECAVPLVKKKECAVPVKYEVHPFFNNANFEFYANPKKQYCGFCDACGKDLLGSSYLCSKTGYALHPCCLNLQHTISSEEGRVIQKLCHDVPSDCVICKQRYVVRNQFKGWSYVFEFDRKSCVHVSCLPEWIECCVAFCYSNNNEEATTSTTPPPPPPPPPPTTTRSKGIKRSILKFTGKLMVEMVLGDFNSIVTIVDAVEELLGD